MAVKILKSISEIITPERHEWYLAHPDDFIHHLIFGERSVYMGGTYDITPQQLDMLYSVMNNRRTSVSSGKGLGKSTTLSWLTILWLSLFSNGQVYAFAPTSGQMASVLWPEIAKWLKGSALEPYFTHTARRLYLNEDEKNTFALPRTASKDEAAQGLHEENMLLLVDEASGVKDSIGEALLGTITKPNNRILLVSNPTKTSGFFYDSHHRNKRFWNNYTFSSENSSNVDREWLDDQIDKFTNGDFIHDMYKINVLGTFPSGNTDSLLTLEQVLGAVYNEDVEKDGVVEMGVDVARMGDDSTVIAVRQGNYVFSAQELGLATKSDYGDRENLYTKGKTTAPEVMEMIWETVDAARMLTGYQDTIRIKIDDTGIGGFATDYVELDTEHNVEAIPCNFGGAGNENYANEASIMWGNIKNIIHEIRIPNDKSLIEELSTRRWEQDSHERTKMEPKKSFKKDFGGSPDHADALVLLFADKENENKFIKSYDVSKDVKADISSSQLLGGSNYCSIYCSNNHQLSAVWASWLNGQLRIYDEFIGNSNEIADIIKINGSTNKVIGSANMFDRHGDDLSMKFMDRGIFITEPFRHDEFGSINKLNTIASRGGLVTARECQLTRQQLRSWTTVRKGTDLKENFGMCYAITQLVSELINTRVANIEVVSTHYDISGMVEKKTDANNGFMSI